MDLREFIRGAEELGELRVIEGADYNLEMGAISFHAARMPNQPAVLFDNIKGYKKGYRVLSNYSLTDKRKALAMGLPLNLSRLEMIRKLRDKLKEVSRAIQPVEVKDGPVLQNVHIGDAVDLYMFPAPKWQENDGGRYIGTGDNVIVRDPDEGWVNVSAHRVQIHDKTKATIYIEPGRHADIIRKKYWSKGLSCPAAVTCGGEPLGVFVAGTRLPWGKSEYEYLSSWNNKPLEVIKGLTTGLPIPANAEIVLEGEIVPPEVESRSEGPFSEWTGHLTQAKMEAAFRVKAILHRNDPIILGHLPYLGPGVSTSPGTMVYAARVWDELDRIVFGVKGVWFLHEFGSFATVVVSIKQSYGGHAKQAAMIALNVLGCMHKYVIIVDEDVDPTNLNEVLFAVGLRSDPESIDIIRGCWGEKLDPLVSPEKRAANDFTHSAAIIMACKPYSWIDRFPPVVTVPPDLAIQVKNKWEKYLR